MPHNQSTGLVPTKVFDTQKRYAMVEATGMADAGNDQGRVAKYHSFKVCFDAIV
jgi:hypothetical protein